MVTPLDNARCLDREGLSRLIEGQIAAEVDALFILGSTGEGPQLSDSLYEKVARESASLCLGRVPLLAGASDNSVDRCLHRLDRLAQCKIEYGVVTLPYYGWPASESHSIRFYTELASRSPLPIVAYNLPQNVGWRMPSRVLEELCGIPNLVGIKDTHSEFEEMVAIAKSPRRSRDVSYFPGNSFLGGRLLAHGADGIVSTPSNIFPRPFVDLIRCFREGRSDLVARIDGELIGVMRPLLNYLPTTAASIKGLLDSRGICSRYTVEPWPYASDADINSIQPVLHQVERLAAEFAALVRSPTGGGRAI